MIAQQQANQTLTQIYYGSVFGLEYGSIKSNMNYWRMGEMPISETGYIDFHWELAEKVLEANKENYEVISKTLEKDEWGDGMKIMFATLKEKKTGNLVWVRWSDSHDSGNFTISR